MDKCTKKKVHAGEYCDMFDLASDLVEFQLRDLYIYDPSKRTFHPTVFHDTVHGITFIEFKMELLAKVGISNCKYLERYIPVNRLKDFVNVKGNANIINTMYYAECQRDSEYLGEHMLYHTTEDFLSKLDKGINKLRGHKSLWAHGLEIPSPVASLVLESLLEAESMVNQVGRIGYKEILSDANIILNCKKDKYFEEMDKETLEEEQAALKSAKEKIFNVFYR